MQNIGVVFGGKSVEREISILSCIDAISNLDVLKYQPYAIYMDNQNVFWYLSSVDISSFKGGIKSGKRCIFLPNDKTLYVLHKNNKLKKIAVIDCILNVCHGGIGENGGLCGLFEMCGLPYTNCGLMQSSVGMNKHFFKLMLTSLNVPTIPHTYVKNLEELKKLEVEYPVIVKPTNLGSSIGISKANNYKQLEFAVSVALKYDCGVVIEKLLTDFTEINCAAVKNADGIVLSMLEQPIYSDSFLSFSDKYLSGDKMTGQAAAKRIFPATVSESIKKQILGISKKIYTELNMAGVVRIDYLLDGDDVFVNEINTVPGALSNYLFNFRYSTLLDILIEGAFLKRQEEDGKISDFDSSIINSSKSVKLVK